MASVETAEVAGDPNDVSKTESGTGVGEMAGTPSPESSVPRPETDHAAVPPVEGSLAKTTTVSSDSGVQEGDSRSGSLELLSGVRSQ
jgi:hypothetical protein